MFNFLLFQCTDGWNSTVWSHVHRTVLHLYSHLGESVLLPIWLLVSSFYHLGRLLLTDRHCHGLLSAVRGGTISSVREKIIVELFVYKLRSFFPLKDYNWWWRSFIVSGGSAIYVFAYAVFYFFTQLDITGFIPTLLYFGYTALMVLTFWLLTGTIGFYAAYFFVRKIYAAVKID